MWLHDTKKLACARQIELENGLTEDCKYADQKKILKSQIFTVQQCDNISVHHHDRTFNNKLRKDRTLYVLLSVGSTRTLNDAENTSMGIKSNEDTTLIEIMIEELGSNPKTTPENMCFDCKTRKQRKKTTAYDSAVHMKHICKSDKPSGQENKNISCPHEKT